MTREFTFFGNLSVPVVWAICLRWPTVTEKTWVAYTENTSVTVPVLRPFYDLLSESHVPMPGFRAAAWRFLGRFFHRSDWHKRGAALDFMTTLALADIAPAYEAEHIELSQLKTEDGKVMYIGYGPRSDVLAIRKERATA